MALKPLTTRIPEACHKYLKNKANLEGLSMQELVAQIIIDYQKQDGNYLASLNQLVAETQKKGGGHDA